MKSYYFLFKLFMNESTLKKAIAEIEQLPKLEIHHDMGILRFNQDD